MAVQERERQFFDEAWAGVQLREIGGRIVIPGVESLDGKRILICSCGTGIEPVRAARQGAETHAFDISISGVKSARTMAEYNQVSVEVAVSDFHRLAYPDSSFDVLYGSSVLHHVDCALAGREISRVLKPGGVAYFRENSDKNPLIRLLRRGLFGQPDRLQKSRVAFVRRTGSSDEYPLTEAEIGALARAFDGQLEVLHDRFLFFYMLNFLVLRNRFAGKLLRKLDALIGQSFPALKKYSFSQQIFLRKA